MISSFASITSSSSAAGRVEKATSEFLMGPDWTMNIDICDTINTNQMLAKDVVKAVKKRLQHKNPKVQLLSLTLLETMVKNCGDYVHFQIAERNILQDMVKIVKKRTDMHVRDKVLALIGSWYEAFGGSQGRYPQYFMAYEDLRRSGVEFPKSSPDAAPIFTPPVTHHPISKHPQPGYGMPSSSSTRLDEAMAADDNFSLSNINSMRDVLDLLTDMLRAVDPSDRSAVKDEVIVDLVEQCRANQKKLMEVLATNGDEELLGQGLELNDDLQSVLSRHDAMASGSPLPLPPQQVVTNGKPAGGSEKLNSSPESVDVKVVPNAAASNANNPSTSVVPVQSSIDDDEEEEDDFALLARRHSKPRADASHGNNMASSSEAHSRPVTSNALVPVTSSPAQTKDQDIIDLLSLTLSTTTTSSEQTDTSPVMHNNNSHPPSSTYPGGVTFSSETSYPVNPAPPAFNNYVAPWAQPQPQSHSHPAHPVNAPQFTSQPQLAQHQSVSQFQPQRQFQPEQQQLGQYQSPYVSQPVSQQHQYSSAYPPPPWASTPGYYSNPTPVSRPPPQTYSMPSRPVVPSVARPLQLESINGNTQVNYSAAAPNAGQKPAFIPSYRLFEDIDVFGNTTDGRFKGTGKASNSLSGSANQSMVGGRKFGV